MAPAAVIWPWVPNSRSAVQTDGLAQLPGEALAAIQIGEAELPPVEGGVGSRRIEFQRGETLLHVFRRARRRPGPDP